MIESMNQSSFSTRYANYDLIFHVNVSVPKNTAREMSSSEYEEK